MVELKKLEPLKWKKPEQKVKWKVVPELRH